MAINTQNVSLRISAGEIRQFPSDPMAQVAFSGRSNVGKSSLINTLLSRKSLARVSATPGKTITINFYDVDNIIRVGSCGSFSPDLHARDIIVAMGACTNGNYASQYNLPGTFCPIADFDLVRRAAEECEKAGVNYRVGNILSSDMFYDDANSGMQWAKMGVLGVEMESAALYCNAARAGKKALCICTVSDSFIYPEENTTAEERQTSFTKMMEIALALA